MFENPDELWEKTAGRLAKLMNLTPPETPAEAEALFVGAGDVRMSEARIEEVVAFVDAHQNSVEGKSEQLVPATPAWEWIDQLKAWVSTRLDDLLRRAPAVVSNHRNGSEADIELPPEVTQACPWAESLVIHKVPDGSLTVQAVGPDVAEARSGLKVWKIGDTTQPRVLYSDCRVGRLSSGGPELQLLLAVVPESERS